MTVLGWQSTVAVLARVCSMLNLYHSPCVLTPVLLRCLVLNISCLACFSLCSGGLSPYLLGMEAAISINLEEEALLT